MNDVTDAAATFRQRLDGVAADIERLLERLLDAVPLADERARPQRLMDAMRYASLGGGKRLFDGFSQSLDLEHLRVRQSPFATFIHYRVKR